MDDIASLRQIDARATHAQARLYAPATAIRVRIGAFTGTPAPKDEPLASNPPAGAMIDYVLAEPAKKPVELAIYDAENRLVRRYSSADRPANRDPAKTTYAPEWIPRVSQLASTRGMHRFVWPLRYAKPGALANSDTDIDGVWAPPGRYTVELAVDGKRLRQPLSVAPDPRVMLAEDVYAQQFAFARDIQAAQVRVADAESGAKKLNESLVKERSDVSAKPELAAAIDVLDADVVARAGIVDSGNPHNAWALPPSSTTSLRFMGETFEKLAGAVDGADAAPTPDARAGYAAALPMLEQSLAAWTNVRTTELAALNARLKAAGRKEIVVEASAAKGTQKH
jgi:hypothetical protein